MSAETGQAKYKDDFQWAADLGYLKELNDAFPAAESFNGPCHQLMVFTGQHAGAGMPLANGSFSLGRSYDCDIVLKDPGIEPFHMTVICKDGAIALRPELGAVYLDGRLIDKETALPPSPVVLSIAGIHFGLAVEGAVWTPLNFPRIDEDPETPQDENHQEQARSQDAQVPQTPIDTATHIFATGLGRLRKANTLSKLVPVAFVLIFMISAAFFFHIKIPDKTVLIAEIENRFHTWHLSKPAIQINGEGFLDITAYVPTGPRKEEIMTFLQGLPVAVRPHVYIEDQVKSSLQDYISKMAFPLEAVYQGDGRAWVTGVAENQQAAEVMANLLKSNVSGLRTVDLHVRSLDQVRIKLTAMLREADLADKIEIQVESNQLIAEGALDHAERTRWQTAKETMLKRLGRQVPIIDQTGDRQSAETIPGKVHIPIAGVTMQPYPFITLQDGKVYFKGASLKNGTVIKDIGPERIVVEIDGRDYYYNY